MSRPERACSHSGQQGAAFFFKGGQFGQVGKPVAVLHRIGQIRPNMSQRGAFPMSLLSQIRNGDRQHNSSDMTMTVVNLVTSLRETEQALRASIQAEEEKTSLYDQSDRCYSMLAHSMRARADNLRMTIATLEATRHAA
jgi:hypothetical protein